MAVQFNYADYLLFSAASGVNENLYTTVISGVLGMLQSQYGLYTEAQDISHKVFNVGTAITLPISPINTITSIEYDGSIVDDTTYTWYGEDIVFTTPFTDKRKPVTFNLNVGYTDIPTDLKLAIYRHIDSIIFTLTRHTDNIEKAINSTGNTVYYNSATVPKAVLNTYDFYSKREIIRF